MDLQVSWIGHRSGQLDIVTFSMDLQVDLSTLTRADTKSHLLARGQWMLQFLAALAVPRYLRGVSLGLSLNEGSGEASWLEFVSDFCLFGFMSHEIRVVRMTCCVCRDIDLRL